MHEARPAQRSAWLLAIAAGCLALAACGGGDDEPADAGEPCNQEGLSMTGCMCSDIHPPGSRECRADFTWSPCKCPPAQPPECVEPGDTVTCAPCQGETKGRIAPCLTGGTFDCGCDR